MEFHLPGLPARRDTLEAEFLERVAHPMGMDVRLTDAARPKRVAIMVSKQDHCLLDLLWRSRRGELHMTIPMVISNHPDLADPVRRFAVPFIHIPVTADRKPEAERWRLELLADNVGLVVLARYMQILSRDYLDAVGCPLINVHHSFLPAFVGAKPYERAKERGVKLIGATAHYVTEDLDEGPIIEQDVVRVSYRNSMSDLSRLGADVERVVLSRAVGGTARTALSATAARPPCSDPPGRRTRCPPQRPGALARSTCSPVRARAFAVLCEVGRPKCSAPDGLGGGDRLRVASFRQRPAMLESGECRVPQRVGR